MTTSDKSEKLLNPKETQLIHHLTSGLSLSEAAAMMDMDYQNAYRLLKKPHVQAAYEEITKNIGVYVRKQIEGLSTKAIQALEDILESNSYMAKVQGVKIVLDRLDPETLKIPAQPIEQAHGPIPAELLPYVHEDELAAIDTILARAQERKVEAESKVTPIRRQA